MIQKDTKQITLWLIRDLVTKSKVAGVDIDSDHTSVIMKYNLKFKKKIVSVTKIKVIEYSNGTIIYKDNHIKKV